MMTRRGRKRNEGDRYPCGKLVPQDETPIGELNRARRSYLRDLRNPMFETELGFLHLAGHISDIQRLAGEEFRKLVEKYRRIVMDGTRVVPKTSQLEPRISGEDSRADYALELIERIRSDYDQAYAAVIDRNGQSAMQSVYRLCVDNGMLTWWERENVKPALTTLAQFLRLK